MNLPVLRLRLTWPAVARAGLLLAVPAAVLGTAACTSYEGAYEEAVYDQEPVYCYRSLADVACHRSPDFKDERRLVNYYGPAPSKYKRPKPPPMAELQPPPPMEESEEGEGEDAEACEAQPLPEAPAGTLPDAPPPMPPPAHPPEDMRAI